MKSHEYAMKLHEIANLLLARQEFDTGWHSVHEYFHFRDKEQFVAAVAAIGAGTPHFDADDFVFVPAGLSPGINCKFQISKVKICRMIRPAEYEMFQLPTEKEFAEAEKQKA